jgi:hypothetical protein
MSFGSGQTMVDLAKADHAEFVEEYGLTPLDAKILFEQDRLGAMLAHMKERVFDDWIETSDPDEALRLQGQARLIRAMSSIPEAVEDFLKKKEVPS